MNRRQFLGIGATIGTITVAGCTIHASSESDRIAGPEIGLELVVEGLTFPTAMAFLPDGTRLVCERAGQIVRHTDDGIDDRPFLDLGDRLDGTEGEKGLLGIALHPDFADNRRFFVRYSGPLRDAMPEEFSHTAVLSSFEAQADFSGVRSGTQRIILEVAQPGPVHNAGDLTFGPDDYLYVALGDGRRTDIGENGDSWWYEKGEAAQRTTDNLRGGILRIDPDGGSGDRSYASPPDNPLVGEEGRDEYFAWGLRNPYRISFDGDRLFVGEVGENTRESVYLVESGDNCGWPVLEGSSCSPPSSTGHELADGPWNVLNPKTWLSQTNRISPYKLCPQSPETEDSFVDPIVEYERPGARSVTGGYVYRGDAIPALHGTYLFGDFIQPSPVFAIEEPNNGDGKPWPIRELPVDHTDGGRLEDSLLSFARDSDGEVYLLTTGFAAGSGRIRRIVSPS